ncbi:MAG TPA: HAD hydrolase family protein [Candidatus Obscuribacterales bacterium]
MHQDEHLPGYSVDSVNRARKIKLLLMDVDGVLTDGKLYYFPGADGQPVEFKGFHSHDGLGFHFLNACGIKTGVISGRESPAVTERARILKMTYVYQGLLHKIPSYEEIISDAGLRDEEVAFIGDDFTDVPLLRRVGLACAVGNARPEVKAAAHFVSQAHGGDGAVREIMELILKAQGHWEKILDQYRLIDFARSNS